MVFLPPDPGSQSQNPYGQTNGSVQIHPADGKHQTVTTTQDQVQYPAHAVDNGACVGGGGAQIPGQEYSYHYTPQSMILVQVNPGETFTIQAEEGTQCIQGPAQVPMVSPNGAIPPIHVPHGYISQVFEEKGLRRVVVIPEMPQAQQMASPQPHGMHHITMQPGPHINYMQQMNMMPLNQQTAMYPTAEHHLPMFHQQPIAYVQAEGSITSDHSSRLPTLPQHQPQFHIHPADMDPASTAARAAKAKERLQKKLMERQQQSAIRSQSAESNKNPSPTSTSSLSPSSSYAATPSPNSSPDSSPRIIGGSVPLSTYSNGFTNRKHHIHHYPVQQQLLSSPQQYHHQYPSPAHSPNYIHGGTPGFRNAKTPQMPSSRVSGLDDMSSGSSSGGSPRRMPTTSQHGPGMGQDVSQFQATLHQRDLMFQSTPSVQEPFPNFDGKNSLQEFLSAILKPEVYDIAPRSAHMKWSLRFSFPKETEWVMQEQKIFYEVFISDKGKDPNKFQLIHRDCGTYFLIKDLKPGVEYYTKVQAELNSVKGTPSEVTYFRTLSCPPDTPGAPKCIHRTKNSLTLKLAAPHDNGEKILKYHIEWDEGKKGSGFRSLYSDTQKQYKVTKLQPAHSYTFRLNSVNKMGTSPWSPEVTHTTSGAAPSTPDPPRLSKANVRSLLLTWTRTNNMSGDASFTRFTLEMDDPIQGYGFRVVHDGSDLRALIKSLTRSTHYKFRLCSYNSEGRSNFSEVVSYLTLPDKPGPPGKVVIKGKAHSTWFKVAWDPPKDNGGAEIAKYVLECSHERGQPMNVVYSGPDREFNFENTQPGVPCRLRVFCMSEGGTSMPSEVTVIVPPPIVPGPCAPPRLASKPKPSMIHLRWDPPNYNGGSSVTSYEVAMGSFEEDTEEQRAEHVYQGPNMEHSVVGLRPGMIYKFVIRAANKVGNGPWSDSVELETGPGCPEKPDAPEPETVTSSSIIVTWKEPHDNGSDITGYSIEWGHAESSMSVRHNINCLSHSFQQLSPDTTYFFRVQAQNEVGKGAHSDVATITTPPSFPDRIAKVWQTDIDVRQDNVQNDEEDLEEEEDSLPSSATSAMIQWEAPNTNGSDITGYIIEITPVNSTLHSKKKTQNQQPQTQEEAQIIYSKSPEVCHLLENLQPDSEYRIRVKAENSVGSSAFSSPVTIETQPLPPDPPVIECTCSYNSLKLKWGDADSFTNIYLVQMREKHGRFVTIYNGSGRSFKVNRLSERTTYHFRINARNHAGEGPFSVIYTFTTTTAPPPPLKYPPSVTLKNGYAEISWDEVEPIKGDPVSYIIGFEHTEDGSSRKNATVAVDEAFYRMGPLILGNKYRVQVAVVRHVCTAHSGPSLKTHAVQVAGDSLKDDSVTPSEENGEAATSEAHSGSEEIAGHFTNWVIFEASVPDSADDDEDSGAGGKSESVSRIHTASSLLKSGPVSMSDDRKAVVLLAIFFLSAVFLAFLVQFLFK